MKKPLRLSPGLRRSAAVLAVTSVLLAGVVVIDRDDTGGVGVSALPGATGQPAPTGPTGGGSGGGSGSGPAFPMQPPDMPSGPPNGYNSGSYPAPDQGNGISIYNSGAPESPGSQGGAQQGANYPQQLQPANGSQPPNYDAPLQTVAQPSVAPTQAPHSAAPQQPQPSQAQQPQNNQDQSGQQQKQQQCQSAFSANGNVATFVGGGGRSPVFFNPALDPTAPVPPSPCPNCKPDTVQKQLNDMQQQVNQMQQRMDQLERQHQLDQQQRQLDQQRIKQDEDKIKELQDQVKEQQKCSAGDWISAAWGAIGGLLSMFGARKANDGTDFAVGLGGGIAASGAAVKLIECFSK